VLPIAPSRRSTFWGRLVEDRHEDGDPLKIAGGHPGRLGGGRVAGRLYQQVGAEAVGASEGGAVMAAPTEVPLPQLHGWTAGHESLHPPPWRGWPLWPLHRDQPRFYRRVSPYTIAMAAVEPRGGTAPAGEPYGVWLRRRIDALAVLRRPRGPPGISSD
jgi:hypothetical protein